MFVTKEVTFDSAHKLEWEKGKCKNLHGHTYKLRVTIQGQPNETGVVMDFEDIKKAIIERVLDKIDHKFLNDFIDNPTAENLSVWIWNQLKDILPLYEIILWENPTSYVTYRGE